MPCDTQGDVGTRFRRDLHPSQHTPVSRCRPGDHREVFQGTRETMSKLIIIALFVVTAVAVWAWLRRQYVVAKSQTDKPSAEKQPSVADSQAGIVTKASFPMPDEHSLTATEDSAPVSPHEPTQLKPHTVETESVPTQAASVLPPEEQPEPPPKSLPALVRMPVISPMTSPDASLSATMEAPSSKNDTTVPEPEEVKPTPTSQQPASTSNIKAFQSHQREPTGTETKTLPLISEVAVLPNDLTTQPTTTGEKHGEPGDPPCSVASISAVFPVSNDRAEAEVQEDAEPPAAESEPPPEPPTYTPPTPPAQKPKTPGKRQRTSRSRPMADADLRLRLQLVVGRGGTAHTLALVADWRGGMPSEIEVKGTQGDQCLTELRDDCYEPVLLTDAATALQQGFEWRGRGDARQWRWVLGGRELYVLAEGELRGFVSTSGLLLNARQSVLAKATLRDQVLAALAAAGCASPKLDDDTIAGVPPGWILLREVTPTHAVPRRDEHDPLNVLCPKHDIEAHFIGGIRLKHRTWLVGYPPRIRFTGELGNGFQVTIDSKPAQPAADGAFEAPGWDTEGKHRLCFGQQVKMYALHVMHENWQHWHAHDFGLDAAICGASTHRIDGARWQQVLIPATYLVLLGARPGEICYCKHRHGVRSENLLMLVPFSPIWALATDKTHSKKCSARVVLLDFIEPIPPSEQEIQSRNKKSALRHWVAAIRDAGRKQLPLAVESEDVKVLWRRYRVVAKHLRKQLR